MCQHVEDILFGKSERNEYWFCLGQNMTDDFFVLSLYFSVLSKLSIKANLYFSNQNKVKKETSIVSLSENNTHKHSNC